MGRPFSLALATVACMLVSLARAQDQPRFRPAVFRFGPESLVDHINGQALVETGAKPGGVMFSCVVSKTGDVLQARSYRVSEGGAALEEELQRAFGGTKFAPAIYNHQPVDVIVVGTFVFTVVEGKPRVRVFLNQDVDELKAENDFIAPQPVFGGDSKFTGLSYLTDVPVEVKAVVELGLSVDAEGNLRGLHVLAEDPPLLGFGDLAREDFSRAKFIPAFRDGDATECEVVYPICYAPNEWNFEASVLSPPTQ